MTGILTLDDLKDRCIVDDITGCWRWTGALSSGKYPVVWFAPLGRRTSLGVVIAYLKTGKPPRPGKVWHCKCDSPNCANPDHRREGTRSTQMLAAGLERSPLTRARISAGKRAKLTEDQIRAIQASTEIARIEAERHGISRSYVNLIRKQPDLSQLAPGASVFSWRPA